MHETDIVKAVEATQYGACFESPSGDYTITSVNVNRTKDKVYKAIRLTHNPSCQVIDDPWDKGPDILGNAQLVKRLCDWCGWRLSSYIIGLRGTCKECPDIKHEYLYDATTRYKLCRQCKLTLDYEEIHSDRPVTN